MPEYTETELTTIAPGDDLAEMSDLNTENGISSAPLDESSIDGLTRFGPGHIEGLRFKWSIRQAADGYFVDETIGASTSAFSTGPMSREACLAFLDEREAEAHRRFEALRQKFLETQGISSPQRSEATPDVRQTLESVEATNAAKAPDNSNNATSNSTTTHNTGSNSAQSSNAKGVNVDDVMDRIVRLLDEN